MARPLPSGSGPLRDLTASDVCGETTCQVVAVASNEPVDGPPKKHAPDREITGPLAVNLRAERGGQGR